MNENELFAWKILLDWGQTNSLEPCAKRITLDRKYPSLNRTFTILVWLLSQAEETERGRKPSINVSVVGPYRSGKSTLLGNLLQSCNQISHAELHKFEKFTGTDPSHLLILPLKEWKNTVV